MNDHTFHPQLRAARFLPRTIITARTLPTLRFLTKLTGRTRRPDAEIVSVNDDVSVHVFRPASPRPRTPGLLWIHGGGMVLGDAAQDSAVCRRMADELGIVVVSVEYRLAPEHPFPTPLEDCYAALQWLADQPDIDPGRIAVGGQSAGAGLAAALTLLAKERGEIQPVLQLLSYPMLDDRTTTRTDIEPRRLRIWSAASNRFGWGAYLGGATADGKVSPLAAPARYNDLSELPPAWIGVGTNDLFHDEDVAYAERLRQAGVATTLQVVPGAYHNFDSLEAGAAVSQAFLQAQIRALDEALNGGRPASALERDHLDDQQVAAVRAVHRLDAEHDLARGARLAHGLGEVEPVLGESYAVGGRDQRP
jgi:acetyl esterase/lipase